MLAIAPRDYLLHKETGPRAQCHFPYGSSRKLAHGAPAWTSSAARLKSETARHGLCGCERWRAGPGQARPDSKPLPSNCSSDSSGESSARLGDIVTRRLSLLQRKQMRGPLQ